MVEIRGEICMPRDSSWIALEWYAVPEFFVSQGDAIAPPSCHFARSEGLASRAFFVAGGESFERSRTTWHWPWTLAERGRGWTSSQPHGGGGAREGGADHRTGVAPPGAVRLHAEREALAGCTGRTPAGATLYVTLEPCCHQGRQPPCTQAILEAGIARVVVGSGDPNPLVAGKGLAQLPGPWGGGGPSACWRRSAGALNLDLLPLHSPQSGPTWP